VWFQEVHGNKSEARHYYELHSDSDKYGVFIAELAAKILRVDCGGHAEDEKEEEDRCGEFGE